ncbi:Dehydration-responsive element-binding protein 1E [Ananas comosus]|uniref:Dehydration-responsive element-binding protein 1E n=1 Tax=Ananas comosus TaxID=4615 RepID=A0A199UHM5_ANACO|nr:Dehydration-responsive element-binding protein 1E [Ananas comosus]
MEFFSGGGGESSSPSTSASAETGEYATVSSAPPKRPAGRTKFRETRHPVYKGVRRRGAAGRWVCEVREPNKKSRIWLGTFPTAEMAARAHDVAAIALRGRSACLNFADSATLLPIPPSFATTRDIQRAAAEAAEAFRPPEFSPNSPAAATTPPSDADGMSEFYANNAAGGGGSGSGGNVNVNVIGGGGGGGDEGFSGWMSYDDLDAGMYYASMAEGWFVEPPTSRDGGHSNWDEGDGGCDEVSLWSY